MPGERQTEPHQAVRSLTEIWQEDGAEAAWRTRCLRAEAELARLRAERDEAQQYASAYHSVVEALWPYWSTLPSCPAPIAVEKLLARAEAAEALLENQAAEIVALIRSYANVHMTKALADLIEHKYVHGEERSA